MATVRIIDPQKEDRRQRITIITLFAVGIFGISYLVYDYVHIVNRVSVPENLNEMGTAIREWQAEGLVTSFDEAASVLVVEEDKWNERDRDEKVGIIVQLARYISRKNNSKTWAVKVVGARSRSTLGEMGERGLVVQ